MTAPPITVALVDDYDIVLAGVAHMLDRYRDRVVMAELDANASVQDSVDIALYDSFAQPESDHEEIAVLMANPRAHWVVVYTWNFRPDLIASARRQGAHGYLSKRWPPVSSSWPWRPSTPGKSSSVTYRAGPAARSGWIGPAAAKVSPTARRKSSR